MNRLAIVFTFFSVLLCTGNAYADTFGSGADTFDIEFVTVGSPGNLGDSTGFPVGVGAVEYDYRIGKFEVSRKMIISASTKGELGISLADMTTYGGNGQDKPATGVTWLEAAAFVNWLNTSTGYVPAYKFDTSGNYQLWQPGDSGYDPNNLYRNSSAHYFLPSLDEWHKAAYYDPNAEVYYNYTTGSDSYPDGIDFEGDTVFDAIFDDGDAGNYQVGPNDITNVGMLSPFGTAGQGGNVWEWEETDRNWVKNHSYRAIRGGGWFNGFSAFRAGYQATKVPTYESTGVGLRVASNIIPEPTTLTLAALGLYLITTRRRR